MVTTSMCVCTGVSKNSRFSTVYVHKESNLTWPDSILAQDVYRLQCKYLAKALTMAVMLHSYLYIYVLNYLAYPAHNCL